MDPEHAVKGVRCPVVVLSVGGLWAVGYVVGSTHRLIDSSVMAGCCRDQPERGAPGGPVPSARYDTIRFAFSAVFVLDPIVFVFVSVCFGRSGPSFNRLTDLSNKSARAATNVRRSRSRSRSRVKPSAQQGFHTAHTVFAVVSRLPPVHCALCAVRPMADESRPLI